MALSDKEASVLDLSISDESPDRAKDVLLTLIDVYNEKWVKDKNRMAESTSEFIEERLTNLTKELENVDEKSLTIRAPISFQIFRLLWPRICSRAARILMSC